MSLPCRFLYMGRWTSPDHRVSSHQSVPWRPVFLYTELSEAMIIEVRSHDFLMPDQTRLTPIQTLMLLGADSISRHETTLSHPDGRINKSPWAVQMEKQYVSVSRPDWETISLREPPRWRNNKSPWAAQMEKQYVSVQICIRTWCVILASFQLYLD